MDAESRLSPQAQKKPQQLEKTPACESWPLHAPLGINESRQHRQGFNTTPQTRLRLPLCLSLIHFHPNKLLPSNPAIRLQARLPSAELGSAPVFWLSAAILSCLWQHSSSSALKESGGVLSATTVLAWMREVAAVFAFRPSKVKLCRAIEEISVTFAEV